MSTETWSIKINFLSKLAFGFYEEFLRKIFTVFDFLFDFLKSILEIFKNFGIFLKTRVA